jgi:hypothetical protein
LKAATYISTPPKNTKKFHKLFKKMLDKSVTIIHSKRHPYKSRCWWIPSQSSAHVIYGQQLTNKQQTRRVRKFVFLSVFPPKIRSYEWSRWGILDLVGV